MPGSGEVFPVPNMAVTASRVRHRVLNALPHWEGCVFRTGGTMRSPADRAGEEPTAMTRPSAAAVRPNSRPVSV